MGYLGLPGVSNGKASACNVGDPGLIPGSGISPWRRKLATHSSFLAWKIPWMEEPGRLQSWSPKESDTTEWLHFHFHSLVIAFLQRSKRLLISWLQSPSTVILEPLPPKKKSVTVSIISSFICHEVMEPDTMILIFWMLSFKATFTLLFHFSSVY